MSTMECIENFNCVICKNEYNEDDKILVLPCQSNHNMHVKCSKQWFNVNDNCPVCQKDMNQYIKEMDI
ncbi:zinc finger protein, putative [Ichthyophthirius multifiliis]|uniref:Zinc finger protein, putative n=1 Tax=Ichthyophthirius multifiliis TaxID=5932 RepID=G0QR64_ICHMU|nr:zinc finger protein, putative [Ichthyophthirius multifiliis]EGR32289.1 zinc finger protein, putative [Ichthyophthirius multifiliis]|eukprot:XP_004035775.1 zinc finger protein, putative [Ichthyophthirius multifiliis]